MKSDLELRLYYIRFLWNCQEPGLFRLPKNIKTSNGEGQINSFVKLCAMFSLIFIITSTHRKDNH